MILSYVEARCRRHRLTAGRSSQSTRTVASLGAVRRSNEPYLGSHEDLIRRRRKGEPQSTLLVKLHSRRNVQAGELDLFVPGTRGPKIRFRVKGPVDDRVIAYLFLVAIAENENGRRQFVRLLIDGFLARVDGTCILL